MRKLLILSVFLLFSAAGMAADTLLDLTPKEAQKILQSNDGKKMKARADKLLAQPYRVKAAVPGKVSVSMFSRLYGLPLMSEMSDLGYTWRLTGDPRYARRGIEALLGFCRNFPATRNEVKKSAYGALSHVINGLALGGWLFENAMTPEEKQEFARCGAGYIDLALQMANDKKQWYYAIHNWNGLVHGPCGLLAIVTYDYPGNDKRFAESMAVIKRWLTGAIDEKGCFLEGVHYLSYGIDRVLLTAWVARDRGYADLFSLPQLKNVSSMMVQKLIPGTMYFDFRNDSSYRKPDQAALMLGAGLQDPAAAWLWQHGSGKAIFPLSELFARHLPKAKIDFKDYPLAVFFPQRQFSLWRTGWSDRDMLFSIECGPFTYAPNGRLNTHRQADKGHFCFYAFGDKWAIDNGYANDWVNFDTDSRGMGFAHSLVTIDGLSEVPAVDPKKGNTFSTDFINNDQFGSVRADMTAAYNFRFQKTHGAMVKSAVRQTLFARPSLGVPGYAVIFDRIVKDEQPHTWAWNMIFPTDKAVTLRPDGALFTAQNQAGYLKSSAWNQGKAVARFELKQPGTYRLWAELAALNLKFPSRSDSIYLKIDGGQKTQWDFHANGEFIFARRIAKKRSLVIQNRLADEPLELAAGKHTIELLAREPDAAIRKLCLVPIRSDRKKDAFWGDGVIELKLENQGLTEVKPTGKKPNAFAVRIFCDNMKTVSTKDFYMPPNDMPPALLGRFSASGKAVNPRFCTLLLPLRPEDKEPQARCQYTADGVKLTLNWGKVSDEITFHQNKQTPEFRRQKR